MDKAELEHLASYVYKLTVILCEKIPPSVIGHTTNGFCQEAGIDVNGACLVKENSDKLHYIRFEWFFCSILCLIVERTGVGECVVSEIIMRKFENSKFT